MKKFLKFCFFMALSLIFSPTVFAQYPPQPRLLNVSGQAQINVVPDQVYIYLGVETINPDLASAKSQNDEIVKKVLNLTQKFKIEPKHVQTDHISVFPEYADVYDQIAQMNKSVLKGYHVRKTVSICLKDISKFEELISRALSSGVTHVHGVQFMTTQLRKYRDEARAMAVKAAQNKANDLAKELGVKVGKPYTVSEYSGGWSSSYSSWWGNSGYYQYGSGMAQNIMQNAANSGDSPDFDGSVALGQIQVSASVNVSFELQ